MVTVPVDTLSRKLETPQRQRLDAALVASPSALVNTLHLETYLRGAQEPLISRPVVSGTARLFEALLLAAVGAIVALFYLPAVDVLGSPFYLMACCGTALVAVTLFSGFDLYAIDNLASPFKPLSRLMLGWSGAVAMLMIGIFLFKMADEFSRVWLIVWFTIGLAAIAGARASLAPLVRTWLNTGRLSRRTIIIGDGDQVARTITTLRNDPESDLNVVGIVSEQLQPGTPGHERIARFSSIEELVLHARRFRIDVVILDLPLAREAEMADALNMLRVLPVDIKIPAHASKLRFQRRTYSYIGTVPFIDVFDRPIADWGLVAKSTFDKVIAATALLLLAPVMAAVALAIKLESRGPVLFRQKRYGFNNELIEIFKFRSMYTDMADASAAKLVTKDDPRVTAVGRFIRKTSIDELPQLLNVLRGELSLVGPRPHALQAKAADRLYDEVVDGYFARHKVKPGITGWAQINGWRGETDTSEKIQKRVEYDLYYIENWSLLLDIYILLRTPLALLDTRNAY
ncbi:MAG: undecaprenyl-phosphate glucose phosphotransferase [Hyphomicrobiaceae bacterium]